MKNNIYQNWQYNVNVTRREANFEVIPPLNLVEKTPKILYKFYSLSDNAVDALTNLYVYASHPFQLNDPLDCCNDIIQIDDQESMRVLWGNLYFKFCKQYPNMDSRIKASSEAFSTIIFRKWGILSLTSEWNSETMWSLYAQNTGFRVGFNVSQFPFSYKGPFPINYCDHLQPIKSSIYGVQTAALIQTNVKHSCWSHEHEWRLLVICPDGVDMQTYGYDAQSYNRPDDHSRKYHYPFKAISSITLGCDFFKEAQSEHRLHVIGINELNVMYNEECLQTKLLDFLHEAQQKYSLKVLLATANINSFNDIPLSIIKVGEYSYRLLEL